MNDTPQPDTSQQAPQQTPAAQPSSPAPAPGTPQPGLPGESASAALGAAPAQATTQAPQQTPGAAPNPQPGGAAPAPSPQQQVAVAQVARHAALGRLASYLLGHENQYNVNPQTGQVDATQVQRKPGDLFRSIVTGAVMGMAAGAGSHDFTTGLGRGGAAGAQNAQAMDQQKYQRAQQQSENFQKEQQYDEQKKYREAQTAQMTANGLRDDANFNLMSQRYLDERNDRERAFQFQLDQMGAQPMQLQNGGADINGKMGNGNALQKMAGTNLDSVKAPDGMHTLHTMSVDLSGLTMKNGQWVDADGKPVNLEDRTTHTLYQLPDNIWNKHADGVDTGDELNKIVGFKMVDPKSKIRMTVGDVMTARAKGQENALQQAQLNIDVMKARYEAANTRRQLEVANKQIDAETYKQFLATYDTVKTTVSAIQDQIKNRQAANPDANVDDLQKELHDTTDDLEAIRQKLYPKAVVSKGGATTTTTTTTPSRATKAPAKPAKAGTPITPDIVNQYLSANGNDPAKARQAATNDGWMVK